MNKNHYNVIFNKARQIYMVVAEMVSGQSKSKCVNITGRSQRTKNSINHTFKTLVVAMGISVVAAPASASIVADSAASAINQAVVNAAKNAQGIDVPVVNIQAPRNGVSHNVYSQFDVAEGGAVLNNSQGGAKSQIVGDVAANPSLKNGEARLIINEVNSNQASQFAGNLEVAGQKADVVIANPSGINIKGGGFINVNRATFTTGKPELNADGSLNQFVVDKGIVNVSAHTASTLGLGGDNNNADYVNIYARAVELNAQVHAKETINVVTGLNTINEAEKRLAQEGSSQNKPTLAVDIKSLGGLYANSIYIIGTEKGLGVNNAGEVQALTNLKITNAGKIENQGNLIVKQDLENKRTDGVLALFTTEKGANGDIVLGKESVNSDKVSKDGLISGRSLVVIGAGNDLKIHNQALRLTGARDGKLFLYTNGNIALNNASVVSDRRGNFDIFVTGSDISLDKNAEIKAKGNVYLNASGDLTANAGVNVSAQKRLDLIADESINVNGASLTGIERMNIDLTYPYDPKQEVGAININETAIATKYLVVDSVGDVALKNVEFYPTQGNYSLSTVRDILLTSDKSIAMVWDDKVGSVPEVAGKFTVHAKEAFALEAPGTLKVKDSFSVNAKSVKIDAELETLKDLSIVSQTPDLVLNKKLTVDGKYEIWAGGEKRKVPVYTTAISIEY